MRTGLIFLTTVLLLAGGWGLLSAQNTVPDELPTNLVPKDVDNHFHIEEVGVEAFNEFEPIDSRFPSAERDKYSTRSMRDLGKGEFSAINTGFPEEPTRSSEAYSGERIMQAGFEDEPTRRRGTIRQISSEGDNPFLTGNNSAPAFSTEEKLETSDGPGLPQFPTFDLEPENPELDSDSFETTETDSFELPPLESSIEESSAPVSFSTANESTSTEEATSVSFGPATSVNTFDTGDLSTERFAPAPWAELAVNGPITPSIATRWVNKGVLNVGQPTECELQVRNISATPIHDFLIDAVLPAHVKLVSVEPMTDLKDGQLTWRVDHLKGDEQLSFKVVFIPRKRGPLMAEAHVRFSAMTAAAFHVEEPMLKLAIEGPDKVMIGDAATRVITVANPGTGVAQNVVIHATIPAGLEHAQGEDVALPVGSLNPGEKRRVRLPLVCVAGGLQELEVAAVAEGGLTEVATTSVEVVAPELAVLAEGPRLRFVGRTATYRLTVNNIGSAESSNVRLLHKVPAGFEFVQADKGGKYDKSTRIVQWFVGRLEPEQIAEVQVQLEATALGTGVQRFAAVSDQASRTEAIVETEVDGTPSLVLEILDLDDPVEIGRETAYEIRVRNEGSKAAQMVDVKCELPEGVAFKAARGPSAHKHSENTVYFKPLAQLPAGETAIFRVHVVGDLAGKHNVSVELKSADDDEPLVYQEQTRFYQD